MANVVAVARDKTGFHFAKKFVYENQFSRWNYTGSIQEGGIVHAAAQRQKLEVYAFVLRSCANAMRNTDELCQCIAGLGKIQEEMNRQNNEN